MHDKKYQAGLFDTFLVAAYLYDDNRVKIVFSFAGDKNTIEIPLEDVIDSIDDEASCVRLSSTLSHQIRLIVLIREYLKLSTLFFLQKCLRHKAFRQSDTLE